MLEKTFLEWLVQQTGPVVGLVLALWWQQQNHRAYVARERENTEIHRLDKERLMGVLEQNTTAKVQLTLTNTQLAAATERLVEAFGRLEGTLGEERRTDHVR